MHVPPLPQVIGVDTFFASLYAGVWTPLPAQVDEQLAEYFLGWTECVPRQTFCTCRHTDDEIDPVGQIDISEPEEITDEILVVAKMGEGGGWRMCCRHYYA